MKKQKKKTAALLKRHKQGEQVRKIRFYPICLYFLLDRWLSKMSRRGLRLVGVRLGLIYIFEKGEPKNRIYFSFSTFFSKTSILFRRHWLQTKYPLIEKRFGVKSALSDTFLPTVVEIDTERINVRADPEYLNLVRDRNRIYLAETLGRTLLLLVGAGCFVFVMALGR